MVPTLAADDALAACVASLDRQTYPAYDVVVVDNSGRGLVRRHGIPRDRVRVIENLTNEGFGRAINQGWRASASNYIATLNDDAEAAPGWLEALVSAAESDPGAGMIASCVRLAGVGTLDSAGMLICGDGSSKQRGYGLPVDALSQQREALVPSGSAALYRRAMLESVGGFDHDFFLYCEDTDLGLRARWAGWTCLYAPHAVVEHRYSHSAGRASPLKAYYVERNRLAVLLKNFPADWLLRAPFVSAARYWWHLISLFSGSGAAGQFSGRGYLLPWFVLRAHAAAAVALPRLLEQRREIRRSARITSDEFAALLRDHSISAREVAAL